MYPLDPQDLPYVNASVERFVLNPCGATDGMILSNGLQVEFSPQWSGAVRAAIAPGDAVRIYAARFDSAQLISAVLIETGRGARSRFRD
ncbi:MAG: hypothetical protein JOY91_08880 [Sinobacteraceae bacterium]|nr:hypothetical protein [Nevskiaceae bacterium]